jgi:hypothetical protein
MRLICSFLFAVFILAACEDVSPEERAAAANTRALATAAFAVAVETNVTGTPYRVAVVEEESFALVELIGNRVMYFPADVESAARNVTQCRPTFDATAVDDIDGNVSIVDLSKARKKSRLRGWRVDLQC